MFKRKTVLITNVASQCGYTHSHYSGLVELDSRYSDVIVMAFPCDQFGGQEPGTNEEIWNFGRENYGAEFLVMDKIGEC